MLRSMPFGAKVVAGLLAVLVVSIGTLSSFASRSYEEQLRRSSLAHLENVADMKVERFGVISAGFEGEIRLARDYYNIKKNLPILTRLLGQPESPEYLEAKGMLDRQLGAYREISGYADFLLADAEGRVVYVLDPSRERRILGRPLPDPDGDFAARRSEGLHVSPVLEDPWIEDRFVLMVAAPAMDLADRRAGTIVFLVDVASMLEPVFSATGLGESGQVVVGQLHGDELVCLCPAEGEGGGMAMRAMNLHESDASQGMREALAGRSGSGITGEHVMAWRPVEALELGLIVRTDAEEVFAPAADLRLRVGLVSAGVLVFALVGALLLSRGVIRPVRRIAETAEKIAAGEHERRADVSSADEVGRLAASFNRMADGLIAANASLETRAAEQAGLNRELRDLQARIETHYQALNRAAIVSETDPRGRITYANDMFVHISGYSREELLGQDHRIVNSGYHPKIYFREMWATIGHGHVWTGELKNRAKDGHYYWVDTAIAPIMGDDGKPRAYMAIRFDITARKEAEEKLLLYREIIANSNDAIAILDPDGSYAEQNEAHRRLLGYDDVEILGRQPEFYLGRKLFAEVMQALRTDGFFRGEMLNRSRDGRLVDVELSAFPIRSESGEVVRYIGFKRDITERKKTEDRVKSLNAELRSRVRELDALNRELEAFSYSVSHDLRAPLRSLDGFSHALLEDYSERLDETGQDYLNRIRSASQRMGELIDDMLMLSRVTRREMAREEIDLSDMARSVAEDLERQGPERKVEFVVRDGIKAEGDAHLVRILLENLIGNAWKFTAKSPDARIEFGETWVDGGRAFYVRDNGAGFDMRYARKLFGIFQRLHGHDEFPGTGIGLATVQRIVNRHGGRVWAEGEVDQGATFYFIL